MAWKKGQSGNPSGRPKLSISEEFRKNPAIPKIIERLLGGAAKFGDPNNSLKEDALYLECCKEVVKRVLPALRSLDHTFGDELAVRIIHSAIKADIPMRDKDGDKD